MEESLLQSAPAAQPAAEKHPTFYRPELDALRFCAFLLVFESHALMGGQALAQVFGQNSAAARLLGNALTLTGIVGAYGMWLFFVLSSYLITQLLLIELRRTGTVKVKDFYVRRILRIWPLYFFVWLWASC